MCRLSSIKEQWFSNIRGDLLSGLDMNDATNTIVDDLDVHYKPEEVKQVMGH